MADKKKTGVLAEFKKFIIRGNVIDLAVGVIIGAAFQSIVTSVVNDLVMPFIGLLTGGINFNDQFVVLRAPDGVDTAALNTLSAAKSAGATVFAYGSFITAVINFVILAFVIFCMVKGINKLRDHGHHNEEAPVAPVVRLCPYCKSEIPDAATRCPHCTSELGGQ